MAETEIKEKKQKLPYMKKVRLILISIVVLGCVIYTVIYVNVAKNSFFNETKVQLRELALSTRKSFVSEVNAEKKLALQMGKSAIVKNYCKNPTDSDIADQMKDEMTGYATSFQSGTVFYCSKEDLFFHYLPNSSTDYYVNPSNPENYWWDMTMNMSSNENYNFNINYNPDLKESNLWVNVLVRDSKRRSLGLVGTGIPLTAITNQLFVDDDRVTMYLFNEKKEIVGAKDQSLVEKKVIMDTKVTERTARWIDLLLERKKDDVRATKDGDTIFCVAPISEVGWYVYLGKTCERADLVTGTSSIIFYAVLGFLVLVTAGIYSALAKYNKMREEESLLGENLVGEVQNLVVASKETAATSQDQSAAVKEIVATMEDSNNLSENISAKIGEVAQVAFKTSNDVSDGAIALETNVAKLHEIYEANQQTIGGIKALGDKIENIWDIVTLINSVADQAKIIAFNAELEASSAGEAGKNFHIVASEIRRLADGIIDGTKEIKEKINEIQQSSDSLILASESGTERINEGCASANELEMKFTSIKNAAEVTANSANDITSIIQQQTAASGQILMTLKQIAAGVENFTAATENVSSSAELLKGIAAKLNQETSMTEQKE